MDPDMVLRVNFRERGYEIVVAGGDLAAFGPFARSLGQGASAFVVTDKNVSMHANAVTAVLSANGFRVREAVLDAGEAQKCLATASLLYDRLVEQQADRKTLIVAVGGGVVGDLAGFVAATYARGLPLLMVPTTLLAMVDSSVGGKVGINHPKAKNLIGAFHQPVGVWINTAFLSTLPEREFRSGLAEVVKYGISLDAELFTYLEANAESILRRDANALRHVITRSCELKIAIVEKDEREETGLRAVLNYGHTFGHAFETVGGYGAWLHGEAVAAGMMCAIRLAARRGLVPADAVERQFRLLQRLGLPTYPLEWPLDDLLAVMRNDKKAIAGKMRFVLPQRLGSATLFNDIPEDEVRNVLIEARSRKP
jgi:3-dehydroquinate synthase